MAQLQHVAVSHQGTRRTLLSAAGADGDDELINVDFEVCEVTQPILSADRLVGNGYVLKLSHSGGELTRTADGATFKLQRWHQGWYLQAGPGQSDGSDGARTVQVMPVRGSGMIPAEAPLRGRPPKQDSLPAASGAWPAVRPGEDDDDVVLSSGSDDACDAEAVVDEGYPRVDDEDA